MTTAKAAAQRQSPGDVDPREAGARMIELVERRGYLSQILGSDPATVERFKTILLSALTSSPKLLQADPATLVQAMREAAMWDLEPDGIDAVIVPYWSSKRGVYEADFQPTARGYVRVLYRTPQIRFVDADVVYENDVFEYEKGDRPRLRHVPAVFGDRGRRLGAYALVVLDSGFVRPIVLNEHQLAQRRARARDAEGGTWAEWPDEMARKTALRALMSLVPIAKGAKQALEIEASKYEQLPPPAGMARPELTPPDRPEPTLLAARTAFIGSTEPEMEEPDEPEAEPVTVVADSPSAVPPEEDFSTLPGFEA